MCSGDRLRADMAPGVKQAVPVDSKSGLAVEFLRTEEMYIYFLLVYVRVLI